ncbi:MULTISPECIES: 2-C-methyl-D-erythritol 4-phosphate cytidylyltransferase [Marinobacter]|uniref:2-C-methyl-D-erythritol 4-phosphate cytidylyltransferase n=1 Tax=Marinobacter suaedae TaxID=3057675 RepID=A0ABT8W0U8_9GAMM|nr:MULTISPECIES: 2-C-methyl-D-erythritol 4-phosphate cytidylyltransferase [unclassified Marinobacter]MBZ2169872.1 2-C-methyl-D-erythritol 4-phosphate cytidylyltransferase [Marinobacter sp. F4216]MDO3721852.1 2-C-methyl-D-erythritol 4-phosphate cytidylyltransferase [Marinobacter sp. chi1]
MTYPKRWLIVPAAGIGQRMQAECPKQYLRIQSRFILDITLSRLLDALPFDGCMVPLNSSDDWWNETEASRDTRVSTCMGGEERADSVRAALQALSDKASPEDWVLVHDAARPCVHRADLERLVSTVGSHPVGGLLAAPVADTLKKGDKSTTPEVVETVDRKHLWRALTPQMFRFGMLVEALENARRNELSVTDESSALEIFGKIPVLVEGRPDNIKVTVPADLELADFLLNRSK